MPGPFQARLMDIHTCTVPPPPAIPPAPFPAPIVGPGTPTVLVVKMPAARAIPSGDMAMNGVAAPHPFPKGSLSVMICKAPALRVGDMCVLGGPVIPGSNTTVFTG